MAQTRLESEAATVAYARKLAKQIRPGQVIVLSGELGAGKSVFARALMRALGVTDEALPSPTFALIQTYDGRDCQIAHMDWYRLDDTGEIEMLGVRDYFEAPWITIIEWPERAPSILPHDAIHIEIKTDPEDFELRLLSRS
ncbi:MAG: tRNA (adenosine(37)-N6)-threonylcarbamoyltransferase complex ATPase subunit type 1 TsaE [Mariprofundaceae bacterium]|nr:tRNA (adenosine(37)-N6)-threonylcarbamoyltransferase complex ATPase subunit type 1 TsaE [Mariprofundaceae bacterium]